MPRPRFTLRRMMLAVAIAGAVLTLKVRRDRFLALAAHHAAGEELTLGTADAAVARDRARAAWRDAMNAKYRRAARYPWLPVAPDPSEPK